ncbi:unnamed protein product [Ilex paraguariensis]|uniref:Uncharacterized protein n=1 Tax=Ilex paraguariensis TaxID=185542 RepID=A0ABC8RCV2_9AQUA
MGLCGGPCSERCFHFFPCLSDPARRSTLCLKAALVMLHLVFVGLLFLFDRDLIEKTREKPWYTALYLSLVVATLGQYFLTSGSSPGYVLDAMRAVNERDALIRRTPVSSKHSAPSKSGSVVITVDAHPLRRNLLQSNTTSWTKLVLDMYPPGSSASRQGQNIVMIVTNAFFSLIITVFGLEHA